MPAPQSSAMQQIAQARFIAFATKLPMNWRQPHGQAAEHFHDAFTPAERVGVPPLPPLFVPATLNQYHIAAARDVGQRFATYIEGICAAICRAWQKWLSQATLSGVTVNGPVASGGTVSGPAWYPLIMETAPAATAAEKRYSEAIAQAVSDGWLDYQSSLRVPGLAWYPLFAALPSPIAPPTPNTPAPVAALTQVETSITKRALTEAMIANLDDQKALHHQQLFASLAEAFEKTATLWKASTLVTNVLGSGPVPSFAPPVVPVGPVVGGTASMPPGGFQ